VDRGKEGGSYKIEVFIKEKWEIVIKKVHRKRKQLLKKK
jgi:hypothetical protein